MNIFGLFFSFLIPGIVIGLLMAEAANAHRRKAPAQRRTETKACNMQERNANTNKLFVYSMADDVVKKPVLKLIKGEESRRKLFVCDVNSDKAA